MQDPSNRTPEYEILFHSPYVFASVTQCYYSKSHTLTRFIRLAIRDYHSAWLAFYTEDDYNYEEYVLDLATNIYKDYEEVEMETGRILSIGYRYKRFEISYHFVVYINAAITQMIPTEQTKIIEHCHEIGQKNIRALDFLFGQYCMKIDLILNDGMETTQDRNPNIVATGFETTGVAVREVLKEGGRYTGHMIRYLGKQYTAAAVATNGKKSLKPVTTIITDVEDPNTPHTVIKEDTNVDPRLVSSSLKRKQWATSVNNGAKTLTGAILFPVRYTGRIASKFAEDHTNISEEGLPVSTTMTPAASDPSGNSSTTIPVAPYMQSSDSTAIIRRGNCTFAYPMDAHTPCTTLPIIRSPARASSSSTAVAQQHQQQQQRSSSLLWDTVGGIGNGAASIFKGITEAMSEMGIAISDAAIHHATTIHNEDYANSITKNNLEAMGELSIASYRLMNVFTLGLSGLMIDAMIEGTSLYVSLYDYLLGPILLQGYMPMMHLPLTTQTTFFVVLRPWSIAFYHSARDVASKPYKIIPTAMLDTLPQLRILEDMSRAAAADPKDKEEEEIPQADFIQSTEAYYGGRHDRQSSQSLEELLVEDLLEDDDDSAAAEEEEEKEEVAAAAEEPGAVSFEEEKDSNETEDEHDCRRRLNEVFSTGNMLESEGVGYIVNINTNNAASQPLMGKVIEPMEVDIPASSQTTGTAHRAKKGMKRAKQTIKALARQSTAYLAHKQSQLTTILANWNGGKQSHVELNTVDCSSYLLYPPIIPIQPHHLAFSSSQNNTTLLELWYNELAAATRRVETIAKRRSGAEELAMLRRLQCFVPKTLRLVITIKRYIHTTGSTVSHVSSSSSSSSVCHPTTPGSAAKMALFVSPELDYTSIYTDTVEEDILSPSASLPIAPYSPTTNNHHPIISPSLIRAITASHRAAMNGEDEDEGDGNEVMNESADVDMIDIYGEEQDDERIPMKSPPPPAKKDRVLFASPPPSSYQSAGDNDDEVIVSGMNPMNPMNNKKNTTITHQNNPATSLENVHAHQDNTHDTNDITATYHDRLEDLVESTKESISVWVESFNAYMSAANTTTATDPASSTSTATASGTTNNNNAHGTINTLVPISIRLSPKTYNGIVIEEECKQTMITHFHTKSNYLHTLQSYLHSDCIPAVLLAQHQTSLVENIKLFERINDGYYLSDWEYSSLSTATATSAIKLIQPVNSFEIGKEYGLFAAEDCKIIDLELYQHHSMATNSAMTTPGKSSYSHPEVVGVGQLVVEDIMHDYKSSLPEECGIAKDYWIPIFANPQQQNKKQKSKGYFMSSSGANASTTASVMDMEEVKERPLGRLLLSIQVIQEEDEVKL